MDGAQPPDDPTLRRWWQVQVRFADQYVWLLLVAALDALLTWLILQLGGREVNPIAESLLRHGGFAAMILFKFAMIALVIVICEYIGRRQQQAGSQLAWVMVGIGLLPVAVALSQLVVAYG
ncbi:MAG: DUF5658 family protein [Phycisphaeraceae bacterium]